MDKKLVYVCLLGSPNSGKSTLFNLLLNQKISIVTHKVHTTRENIKGIITKGNTQLIFIDTPGFLRTPRFKLEKAIVKKALQEVNHVDFICIIIDVAKKNCLDNPLLDYRGLKLRNPILIFNKVDLIQDKTSLLPLAQEIKDKGFDEIFMISALKNKGINSLRKYLVENAPKGNWHYDKDQITDRSIKELAEDITLEKLYKLLNQEIPYSLKVETESWKEDKSEVIIHQTITVLKNNQKTIILGTKGENIKRVRVLARGAISKLTNKKIRLYLFIKVRENWMNKLSPC